MTSTGTMTVEVPKPVSVPMKLPTKVSRAMRAMSMSRSIFVGSGLQGCSGGHQGRVLGAVSLWGRKTFVDPIRVRQDANQAG